MLAVRFRGWMKWPETFLAVAGGGWLGPEWAVELGDR